MRKVLVLPLLAATSASTARAEPPPPAPKADDGTPTVVVTGTRTPERVQRAVVKTDVVSRAEAERRGAANVADALATQPGVRVDTGASAHLGGVAALQIQGFDRQRVLVLEDGERVIGDVGGALDLAALPLSDVERIEIVSGPASALYGSSAIGGVVNVITGPPTSSGPHARATIEGRSRAGALLSTQASLRHERAWASLDASLFRQDGVARTPGLPDLHVPDASRRMLGARAGVRWTEGADLRLRARWLNDERDGLTSMVAPGLGRYVLEQPAETDRYALHAVETLRLGKGADLRVSVGSQWIANTTAQRHRDSVVGERHLRRGHMQSLELVSTVAHGPLTWVLGARAELEAYRQQVAKKVSTSDGVVERVAEEVAPANVTRAATYAQLEWKLGPLAVLPGFRAEHDSRYGASFAPRVAASVRPAPDVTLRASAGRGLRAPSAKELGFTFDHGALGYRVLGSPDLKPETSWGANADVAWSPSPATALRAGAFANWVENLIELDLSRGQPNGGLVDYWYTNFGRARTMGGSLSASARVSRRFRSEIAYDHLWTRDDVNARPLAGRPPHTLTASVGATVFWQVEVVARFRTTSGAYVSDDARSPLYSTLDLRVARPLWPRSEAYVGVLDVTDVHQEPGRLGDLRPALGRVFYLGVRAELPWEQEE